MALSRVTTWSPGNTLTASALNGEFNNILDNALALISPLTGNLNANGFAVTNFAPGTLSAPGFAFNNDSNTGFASLTPDVLELVTSGARGFQIASASSAVNWLQATPAAAAVWPTLSAQGEDASLGIRLEPKGTSYVAARRGRSTGETFWPSFGFYEEHGRAGVAGVMQIAAGTLDLIAGGRRVLQASAYADATNYVQIVPAAAGNAPTITAAGGDTNTGLTIDTKGTGTLTLGSADTASVTLATALIPASLGSGSAVANVPLANALYKENGIAAWVNFKATSAASIYGSFGVTSVTRNADGNYTLTWSRAFAATPYLVLGTATQDGGQGVDVCLSDTEPLSSTTAEIRIRNNGNALTAPQIACVAAIGRQA